MSRDKVFVETVPFSGWAEVVGYVSDDFFPIEIELIEGDSEGHKHKRICKDDIKFRE